MSEEIIIVDKEDNIIGHKDRYKLNPSDIYRVSALWLTNSNEDILLAQRSFDKKHHPGKWGPAVAGTVKKGQSYDDSIIEETAEEIGLKNIKLTKSFKKFNSGDYYHFTQWYTLVIDRGINDFKIDPKEVADIKWFTKVEIIQKLDKNPDFFIPYFKSYFELFE